MVMTPTLFRRLFLSGAVGCAVLIAIALYFQYVMYLEPCPLCILQRMLLIAMGAVLLVGAIHAPLSGGQRIYAALTTLMAVVGAVVAGRHVWLQHLPPDQVPECGPGIEYMLKNFPLIQSMQMIFSGSGECAEVQWTLIGLSIPEWTLAIFVLMIGAGGVVLLARKPVG